MAEDIITARSRYKSLFVIARNMSFTCCWQTVRLADALGLFGRRPTGYVNDAWRHVFYQSATDDNSWIMTVVEGPPVLMPLFKIARRSESGRSVRRRPLWIRMSNAKQIMRDSAETFWRCTRARVFLSAGPV